MDHSDGGEIGLSSVDKVFRKIKDLLSVGTDGY